MGEGGFEPPTTRYHKVNLRTDGFMSQSLMKNMVTLDYKKCNNALLDAEMIKLYKKNENGPGGI